jgi:hypothetical protein
MWHRVLLVFHMTTAFLFIALIPFTKLWHIFAGMLNYAFRDLEPSALRMVNNIEEAETLVLKRSKSFGWKDLLDLDTCIRCGPVPGELPRLTIPGKHLNPKITLIQHMKQHLDEKAPYLLAMKGKSEEADVVAMTEEAAEEVNPMEQEPYSMMYNHRCNLGLHHMPGLYGTLSDVYRTHSQDRGNAPQSGHVAG